MNRMRIAASLLATLGCSHALALSDTEPLTMVYEAPAPARALPNAPEEPSAVRTPRVEGCNVSLAHVADTRLNKETLGGSVFIMEGIVTSVPIFGASVLGGDGMQWLRGALQTLPSFGVRIDGSVAARALDVRLRLAHAWNAGMNLNSHVVLEAKLPQADGTQVKRYHGFGIKLNWANANREFMETLNLGMHDAVKGLADDLQAVCAGRAVSA